jgi:hypothetical protein
MERAAHGVVPSNRVHIIIDYPKIGWDDWAEYMATLTWFSGIELDNGGVKHSHVIFADHIDEALEKADAYDYAIISYIGSFYYSEHGNTVWDHFKTFMESGDACQGHILYHPHKEYATLHPQCLFLNLKDWRDIGRPSFGFHTGEVVNIERSESNVHDDYTPHWIRRGEGTKHVYMAPMAEYISRSLLCGRNVFNFDRVRNTKFFCYPERGYSEALEHEKNRPADIVYTKNNSKYPIGNRIDGRKFDVIYAPCAGSIGEFLKYRYGHSKTKLVLFDYNHNSVLYKRMLYNGMVRNTNDLNKVESYFRKKGCIIDNCDYKPERVQYNETLYTIDQYIKELNTGKPEIIQCDIVNDMLDIDESKTNLIYFSNIFSYNFLIHKMSIVDIEKSFNRYLELDNTVVMGNNPYKEYIIHEKT